MSAVPTPSGAATADIGVLGLAVMGSNLARNFARHGYTVAPHNRTRARTDEFVAADAGLAEARLGTAAIDNAKLAYQAWSELFDGERWRALEAKGARRQRCLWASTSTKNPHYRDVLYSEELIGRDTVNTMPLSSVEAFADHGLIRGQTVSENLDRARRLWSDLIRVGVDEEEVGEQLEREGVEKFAASYQAMLDTLETKRAALAGRPDAG